MPVSKIIEQPFTIVTEFTKIDSETDPKNKFKNCVIFDVKSLLPIDSVDARL